MEPIPQIFPYLFPSMKVANEGFIFVNQMNDYYESINYPFKSKYKYIKDTHIKTEPYVPDYKLKTAKKLSKPDFSLTTIKNQSKSIISITSHHSMISSKDFKLCSTMKSSLSRYSFNSQVYMKLQKLTVKMVLNTKHVISIGDIIKVRHL